MTTGPMTTGPTITGPTTAGTGDPVQGDPVQGDPVQDVHVGRDGYLFLSGGRQDVFSYFSGHRDPRPGSPGIFARNLTDRAAFCAATGRTFRTVVFPEKCAVLRDRLSGIAPLGSLYDRCYRQEVEATAAASALLYPADVLGACEQPFPRTDTHLSARGNIALVHALTADLFPQAQAALASDTQALLSENPAFCGDLGRKFDPPRAERIDTLKGHLRPIRMADNGLQGGNDGIIVLIESPQSASDGTLVIFGDSFFRQLLPLLAVFYRRVVFCRTRFLHYELIDALRPDHVFCGIAERYLSNCTPDAARPHFLSYPLILGRAQAPEAGFSALWERFVDRAALLGGTPR